MDFLPPDPFSFLRNRSIPRWLLLSLYALLTLGALATAIYLAVLSTSPVIAPDTPLPIPSFTPVPSSTDTPLPQPTATPTLSPYPTFTSGPTDTITPAPTITPTSTRTPPVLLTPAFPLLDNEDYRLAEWTPAQVNRAIELLEFYPETLSAYARGEDNAGYFAAFRYAMLIQREALLRFSTAPEADDWLWRLAYNQARSGDSRAGALFATLITKALNDKTVRVDNLPEWGSSRYPPMRIEVLSLADRAGYLGGNLIEVSTADENGGSFFWLLEAPAGFVSYPLTSDFDFLHPAEVQSFTADLTGDGVPEVGIYRSAIPGDFHYILPHVFDLTGQPPRELPFEAHTLPDIGPDFHNHWAAVTDDSSAGDLQFVDDIFPPCPVTVRHAFDWNGQAFVYLGAHYEIKPLPDLLSYCAVVIDHAARVWGIETAVGLMESLTPLWPPATDVNGKPTPKDALDKWRYQLGLYYALLGRDAEALAAMQKIATLPAASNSQWISPAKEFLATYQVRRDIYRACLLSELCGPRLALQALINTFSTADYSLAPQILREAGVTVRSSGFFDFDRDGTTDRWFVLRHQPMEELELWILVQSSKGVSGLLVGYVNTHLPRITYVEPLEDPPIVRVEPDITFKLRRRMASREPFIHFVQPKIIFSADLTGQRLSEIEAALLSAADPRQQRSELAILKGSSYFTCSYILCPHYYYLLGLANELMGDERAAVDAYLELWRQYPGSPYTIIARLKLFEIRPPTATPTQTLPPTITQTATTTLTPTSTLSPTITLTPTPTVFLTPTPTHTHTPTGPTPTLPFGGYYPPPGTPGYP